MYPVRDSSSLKKKYPTPTVTKKLTPVKIGITDENLSIDNAFIEKNIEINIKIIAKIIFISIKKKINSLNVPIFSDSNLFLIIAAPATLKIAYKNENK